MALALQALTAEIERLRAEAAPRAPVDQQMAAAVQTLTAEVTRLREEAERRAPVDQLVAAALAGTAGREPRQERFDAVLPNTI